MSNQNGVNSSIEKKQKNSKGAYLHVIAAATLWGTIGIYAKQLVYIGFETTQLVLIRAVGAALALLLYLLVKDTKLLRIDLRDSIYFIGTGIISFVFFNWCYFIAINRTSLSIAAILLYTAPAFVTILSVILFKENISGKKLVSLILTFIGCSFVTVFTQDTGLKATALGVLAGLGSGLGYALYSIFGRYALMKYDPLTVTFYTFVFASIGIIPVTDINGTISLLSSMNSIYYAAALALLATVMPFILYTKGLSYLEASKASIIATLGPIVATVVGIALFGEIINLYKILGVGIVVFAVWIMSAKNEGDQLPDESSR